jgi:hypothetical protein
MGIAKRCKGSWVARERALARTADRKSRDEDQVERAASVTKDLAVQLDIHASDGAARQTG